MTKDRLQSLPLSSLKEIAKKEGISDYQNLHREKLIDVVIEALEEERNDRITHNNMAIRGEEKKYDIFRDEEIEAQDKNVYEIPSSYNDTKIGLILVEPQLAYSFWEISDKDKAAYNETARSGKLFLRVHEISCLVCEENNLPDFFDIPIDIDDSSWYINLPSFNSRYYIELINLMYGEEKKLARSGDIESPAKTIHNIDEDLLMLTGVYDFEDDAENQGIPQRIISLLSEKYLSNYEDEE